MTNYTSVGKDKRVEYRKAYLDMTCSMESAEAYIAKHHEHEVPISNLPPGELERLAIQRYTRESNMI